ncbi:hypothetical protein Tco_0303039 [Tanacetum coccineum]
MSQAVPSQSTASAFYQNTARPKVSKAVLSQSTARPYSQKPVFSTSTGRPYYPRMDNVRPRTSSSSPTSLLPQTTGEKGNVVARLTQTWRPKRAYLDYRHKHNGSYTLKKFEYGNPEEELKDHAIIDSGCSGTGKRVLISEETIRADPTNSMKADGVLTVTKANLRVHHGNNLTNMASSLRIRQPTKSTIFSLKIMNGILGTYCQCSKAASSPRDGSKVTPTQRCVLLKIVFKQGTAEAQGAADIPQSPNDYTPTDESHPSR